jgi:hypothetical protein
LFSLLSILLHPPFCNHCSANAAEIRAAKLEVFSKATTDELETTIRQLSDQCDRLALEKRESDVYCKSVVNANASLRDELTKGGNAHAKCIRVKPAHRSPARSSSKGPNVRHTVASRLRAASAQCQRQRIEKEQSRVTVPFTSGKASKTHSVSHALQEVLSSQPSFTTPRVDRKQREHKSPISTEQDALERAVASLQVEIDDLNQTYERSLHDSAMDEQSPQRRNQHNAAMQKVLKELQRKGQQLKWLRGAQSRIRAETEPRSPRSGAYDSPQARHAYKKKVKALRLLAEYRKMFNSETYGDDDTTDISTA